jgi:hypothetical protein
VTRYWRTELAWLICARTIARMLGAKRRPIPCSRRGLGTAPRIEGTAFGFHVCGGASGFVPSPGTTIDFAETTPRRGARDDR